MPTIHLLRHGESTANSGEDDVIDAPLSVRGLEQARALHGHYDLAVISPLRRTIQTWGWSSIYASRAVIDPLCRERVIAERDARIGEAFEKETDEAFWQRVHLFKDRLQAWSEVTSSIIVISHAYFLAGAFDAWGMSNGELREVKL